MTIHLIAPKNVGLVMEYDRGVMGDAGWYERVFVLELSQRPLRSKRTIFYFINS